MLDFKLARDQVDAAIKNLAQSEDLTEVQRLRKSVFSPDSPLVQLSAALKDLPPQQKAELGAQVGQLKTQFTQAYESATQRLGKMHWQRQLAEDRVDLTERFSTQTPGARNPLTKLMNDFEDFFGSMGWRIETGPEIEAEWYNFDALNFGQDHPARAMQDTFYVVGAANVYDAKAKPLINSSESAGLTGVESNLVLRTHTSPVETRALLKYGAPLYMVAPGKVFRTDELDQTHTPVFHQLEGLAIDHDLHMGHLKGVLDYLAKYMFGPQTRTRFRPSFFPFTEPSAEMDVWFSEKRDGPGWVEWVGCGMTHPNVLIAAGIDPNLYRGFAFGVGIERTLMFRHGISDMHDIVEGDIRFAHQFARQFSSTFPSRASVDGAQSPLTERDSDAER
jgi:phenylalanyl-tRNA synthetase alpha chain